MSTLNSELKRLEALKVRIRKELENLNGQLVRCKADLSAAEAAKQNISEEGEENVAFAMSEVSQVVRYFHFCPPMCPLKHSHPIRHFKMRSENNLY